MSERRLRPGQQPYDYANGLRVGGISGALIGGGVFALTGWPWFVVIGAVAGAIGGYLWYRRERAYS
jgi:outer membrane lipoprotein SlyB